MRAQPYPQYALFLHCLCLLLPKSNLNRQVSTKAMFRSDKDSLQGGVACVQGDCLSGVFLTTKEGVPSCSSPVTLSLSTSTCMLLTRVVTYQNCSVGQRPHSQVARIVWCLPVPVAFSSIVNPLLHPFLLMNYKALVVPPTCNDVSNSRPTVMLLVLYLYVYAV